MSRQRPPARCKRPVLGIVILLAAIALIAFCGILGIVIGAILLLPGAGLLVIHLANSLDPPHEDAT